MHGARDRWIRDLLLPEHTLPDAVRLQRSCRHRIRSRVHAS